MQRKSKTVASKKPCTKVSAKKCLTKGVKAKTGGMTAKKPAKKPAKVTTGTGDYVFVGPHIRLKTSATKKPAKAAAKAKPAARPAKRTVKRKK